MMMKHSYLCVGIYGYCDILLSGKSKEQANRVWVHGPQNQEALVGRVLKLNCDASFYKGS